MHKSHDSKNSPNTYLVSWINTMLPQSAMHHHHSSPQFPPKKQCLHSSHYLQTHLLHQYFYHHPSNSKTFKSEPKTSIIFLIQPPISQTPCKPTIQITIPISSKPTPSKFIISHHLLSSQEPQKPCPSQPSLLSNEGKWDSKLRLNEQDIDREEKTGT